MSLNKICYIIIALVVILPGESFPNTTDDLLKNADDHFKEKKYSDAITIWLNLLAADPDNKEVKQKLEAAYEKAQNEDKNFLRSKLLAQGKKAPIPDVKSPGKNIIVLCNFTVSGEPEKHEYYQYIIPQTIGKNLAATGKYAIHRFTDLPPAESDPAATAALVKNAAGTHGADYVITGAVEVMQDSLNVLMKIIDVKGGVQREVRRTSSEVGVLLKDTIDDCSTGVETTLAEMVQQKTAAAGISERPGSPFREFYSNLGGFSLGMEGGRFFIGKKFSGGYKDGYFVRSNAQYRVSDKLGISLGLTYLATDNSTDNEPDPSFLTQWIPTVTFTVYFPPAWAVHPFIAVGGGVAFTEIEHTSPGSGPFDDPASRTVSRDPYLCMTVGVSIVVHPVFITAGSSFMNTFIFGEQFTLFTLHCGIGYRF